MEDDPPPVAFGMNSLQSSSVHIPSNSLQSVQAEVLDEPKRPQQASPVGMFPMNNGMMNFNGMHVPPPNMFNMPPGPPPNMQNMPPPNMSAPQHMQPGPKVQPNMNAVFSEDFMNQMSFMAEHMSVDEMEKTMQKNLKQMQRHSKPKPAAVPVFDPNQNQNPNMRSSNSNKSKKKGNNVYKSNSQKNVHPSPNAIHIQADAKVMQQQQQYQHPQQQQQQQQQQHSPYNHSPINPYPNNALMNHGAQSSYEYDKKKKVEAEANDPIHNELVSMGFERQYVVRACNLYKKKFKNKPYRLEVLTEIIIRLQQRDKSRNRGKSADSVEDADRGNNVAIAEVMLQQQQQNGNGIPLEQSISQNYAYAYQQGNDVPVAMNHSPKFGGMVENVLVQIVMKSAHAVQPETCEIAIRKDGTLQELKELIATCLPNFDLYDDSYAFIHDDSSFVFDKFDMTMAEALELMNVNMNNLDIRITFKIGRIVSNYMKIL